MEYHRWMNDRDQARRISEANSAFRGFRLEAESTCRLVFRPVDLDERLSGHNDWLSHMATRPHVHFMWVGQAQEARQIQLCSGIPSIPGVYAVGLPASAQPTGLVPKSSIQASVLGI